MKRQNIGHERSGERQEEASPAERPGKHDPMTRLRRTDAADIPTVVEERLEETYRIIRSGEAGSVTTPDSAETRFAGRRRRGKFRRSRKASAAVVLLLLVLSTAGLGFLSPTFAQVLQRFPLLDTLYRDKGLESTVTRNLIQPYAAEKTEGDITIGVRNVIYDGTRIVFEVYRNASDANGRSGGAGAANGVGDLSVLYAGQPVGFSYSPYESPGDDGAVRGGTGRHRPPSGYGAARPLRVGAEGRDAGRERTDPVRRSGGAEHVEHRHRESPDAARAEGQRDQGGPDRADADRDADFVPLDDERSVYEACFRQAERLPGREPDNGRSRQRRLLARRAERRAAGREGTAGARVVHAYQ
ncbi:DUF4179 domain-containing protein [Saccharibacillus sp. VR-M41]|uniref:DUF4179 domain-containing protein n=1 Tax=Saccharibacillus alkalitolerans TaxID=2705290 RepID=A0ABX0F6B3_9BACL|nr:DUF4179 domain-containing protein [Saccharibacillus alkalitolerans]